MKRGVISGVQGQVGIGKESDIYKCTAPDGSFVILKLGRLGRTSFKSIVRNRDYLKHRQSYNWLYISRLASIREFTFMQILHKEGFKTPVPIECNRHAIVMSFVEGCTLCHIRELEKPEIVFSQCVDMIEKLLQNGLIHSDFNEFNLILGFDNKVTMIDFP